MADETARTARYASRLSRARAGNSQRLGLRSGDSAADSMANMAFAIPVQVEADKVAALGTKGTLASKVPPKTAAQVKGEATIFAKPDDPDQPPGFWEWNSAQKLMAVVRCHQQHTLRPDNTSYSYVTRVHVEIPGVAVARLTSDLAFSLPHPLKPRRLNDLSSRFKLSCTYPPCMLASPSLPGCHRRNRRNY